MNDAVEVIKGNGHQKGYTATLYYDSEPESPADWDNLGVITYNKSSRYVLGYEGVDSDEDAEIARKVESGEYIGIPVYAYVHSGATICAGYRNPFNCEWDSGRSGWVYVSRADALKEVGGTKMSKKKRETIERILRGQVDTFATYLEGQVYGIVITDPDGEEVDSCWGFYGFDYAKEEAEHMLKNYNRPVQLELFEELHA
jgi:hypothetical protein